MSRLTIVATTAFGLESVLKSELQHLGYTEMSVEDGRISFVGDEAGIARCNLWLRTADRILWQVANFPARDFEELFQGVLKVPWETFIPENGIMHVIGKSVKSQLHSVPDCQAITKKAVVEAMKRKYSRTQFPEDGELYRIEVSLNKDTVFLSLDTSGAGLHKRGYRQESVIAPLRETLAAGVILLSRWSPSRPLLDPMCGSGTIPIEAALMAKNIAPGLSRSFVSERWPLIPDKIWKDLRQEARDSVRDVSFQIMASDKDPRAFQTASDNIIRAGIKEHIILQKKPMEEFSSTLKYGCVICNPPYGERLGDSREAAMIYRAMGRALLKLDTWSFFIITSHPDFEKHFGKTSNKNRKLYNGKIKTYLYQYLGPLPPRKKGPESGQPENSC